MSSDTRQALQLVHMGCKRLATCLRSLNSQGKASPAKEGARHAALGEDGRLVRGPKGWQYAQALADGALLVVVVGVVALGCDWSLFGDHAADTRNSADTGISTSSVGSLTQSWTTPSGPEMGPKSREP